MKMDVEGFEPHVLEVATDLKTPLTRSEAKGRTSMRIVVLSSPDQQQYCMCGDTIVACGRCRAPRGCSSTTRWTTSSWSTRRAPGRAIRSGTSTPPFPACWSSEPPSACCLRTTLPTRCLCMITTAVPLRLCASPAHEPLNTTFVMGSQLAGDVQATHAVNVDAWAHAFGTVRGLLTPTLLRCSLVRKGFTVLHVYDTVTRALVSPQAWEAPPPAFGCALVPPSHGGRARHRLPVFYIDHDGYSLYYILLLRCNRHLVRLAAALTPISVGADSSNSSSLPASQAHHSRCGGSRHG
jgi:hypothetical protein